ncbi:MAG: hypothetical protein PQJ47_05265 [Sphaerochaetaceae bacterium]|nr:hypothetical protein [Sphaerochaetaceae bacterium]
MIEEQFAAERDYHMAFYMLKILHKQGGLDDEEFETARTNLIKKYHPVISTLIRELRF